MSNPRVRLSYPVRCRIAEVTEVTRRARSREMNGQNRTVSGDQLKLKFPGQLTVLCGLLMHIPGGQRTGCHHSVRCLPFGGWGVQVKVLHPFLYLVCLLCSWVKFSWYDFNMPYSPIAQTYCGKFTGLAPLLLLGVRYLSVCDLWVVRDRWC